MPPTIIVYLDRPGSADYAALDEAMDRIAAAVAAVYPGAVVLLRTGRPEPDDADKPP